MGAKLIMRGMSRRAHWAVIVLLGCVTLAAAAENKKEFHYNLGPNATVTVVNQFGPVSVSPSADGQVGVIAVLHSNKVEVDATQRGSRLELRSHFLQNASMQDGRVEYQLRIPADSSLNVRSTSGSISVQGINADLVLEGDAADVVVRQAHGGHIHVRTLNGPIRLEDVDHGDVEVISVSGPVTLVNTDGRLVSVNTTDGKITYNGDFGDGGEYVLANHSGDIDVTLPASASVDISATSATGAVSNDFPFHPEAHTSVPLTQGKSFAGTANAGSSSVRLRSFSGKIHVKKR
ncbi:MAG TPA: DUF4097 family beta strand repeat-containing protein [Terriglobales bacterium]|nr:DUF4097 family beta strand repeat-containing protein [Terriglobales bacterium]